VHDSPPLSRFARRLLLALALPAAAAQPLDAAPVPSARNLELARTFARADTFFFRGQSDSIHVLMEPLEHEARATGNRRLLMMALLHRASAWAPRGYAREALAASTEGLALAGALRDTARLRIAMNWRVLSLMSLGRYDEARPLAERLLRLSLPAGDLTREGWAQVSLGYMALRDDSSAVARRHYERALSAFRRSRDTFSELHALVGLGRALIGSGALDSARACWTQVLERSRASGDRKTEAQATNNLGRLEQQYGDPARAVFLWERALELQRQSREVQDVLVPMFNLARAQVMLGQYDAAESTLVEALRHAREQGYTGYEADGWERLADLYLNTGRYEEVVEAGRRALGMTGGASVATRTMALTYMARAAAALKGPAAAIALLTDSLPSMDLHPDAEGRAQLDRAIAELLMDVGRYREALVLLRDLDRRVQWEGVEVGRLPNLVGGARCARQLGMADSARLWLEEAATIWETRRVNASEPEWREAWGNMGRWVYSSLGALHLGQPTDRPRSERVRAAFDAVERYKARTLLERMSGPGRLDASRAPLTLVELQRQVLRPDETLLAAFATEDTLWWFRVTPEAAEVVAVPDWPRLRRSLLLYRQLVSSPPGRAEAARARAREQAGAALSRELLGGALESVPPGSRLIVIPDAELRLAPWAQLPRPGAQRGRLMIDEHELWLCPSATLLAELRQRREAGPSPSDAPLLGLRGKTNADGRPLPGARRELEWLDRRFEGVQVAEATAETPTALADELSRCRILHVAAHTWLDDQRPWNSGVLLGDARSAEKDAILRASRIAEMHLDARLCVLAGCESAGVGDVSGEGAQGLAAAFLSAGVPAVVATTWPVDDRTTADLMQRFYRELARGSSVAEALRRAQSAVRSRPATRHPFYWAGFVVLGEGAAGVSLPERRSPWTAAPWVAGLAAAAGLAGGWKWMSTRRLAARVT
jgi:tetratricopeptide (TPR) repeat protein